MNSASHAYIMRLLESGEKLPTPVKPSPPPTPEPTPSPPKKVDSYSGGESEMDQEDMQDGGMPPEGIPDEMASDIDIGRIYELKKIYARLISLDNLIEHYSEPWAEEFKERVKDSIEVFQIVINNLEKYKEDIDMIVVSFYKFIKTILLDAEVFISRSKENEEE